MRPELDRWYEAHADFAMALNEARFREDVRVIVVTGGRDGTFAYSAYDPLEREAFAPVEKDDGTVSVWPYVEGWNFRNFKGIIQHHEIAAQCEKPIIARVNGDAMGGGMSIMLSCDLIVARDDIVIADYHMALEEWPDWVGPDVSQHIGLFPPSGGVVPGDGGIAWVPQYLSPARAKEFLLLGRPYTAAEFEQLGVINHVVPADRLDEVVDDLARRLKARAPEMVAMTKRLANRSVVRHLNETLDASAYAEWLALPSPGFEQRFGEIWTEGGRPEDIAP